jgi:hypothetical protein
MTPDIGAINALLAESERPYEFLGFQTDPSTTLDPKAQPLFEPDLTLDNLRSTALLWQEVMKQAPYLRYITNAMTGFVRPIPFGCSNVLYGQGAVVAAARKPPGPGLHLAIDDYWLTLGDGPDSSLSVSAVGRIMRIVSTTSHGYKTALTFMLAPPAGIRMRHWVG